MTLSLPEDLEPYTNGLEDAHSSGAYALELQRPIDLGERWQEHYDTKPDYWRELVNADQVYYVGGTGDLLNRLEDHRDNDHPDRDSKRSTVLTEVCGVARLQVAWVSADAPTALGIDEPRLARWLSRSRPRAYVHTR